MLDRILTGPLARGAFGYAIATVGDVNLDGFTGMRISRHRGPPRLIFSIRYRHWGSLCRRSYRLSLHDVAEGTCRVATSSSEYTVLDFFGSHTFFGGGVGHSIVGLEPQFFDTRLRRGAGRRRRFG